VFVFGIIENTQIIVTLVKIGFSPDSMNISYCALCVSDLLCILSLPWNAICYIPAFINSGLQFLAREVAVPTGGAFSQIFAGTTAWITAFISLERCLCVMFPLKSKDFVRSQRTVIIILLIFIVGITPLAGIMFFTYVFVERFDVGVSLCLNTPLADYIHRSHFMYRTVVIYSLPLVIILVCSITLAVSLKRSISWRQRQSSENPEINNSSQHRSSKDARVVKTVLSLATVYIFLGGLSSVRHFAALMWPEFRMIGDYGRWNRSATTLTFFFSLINSSVNVLIYYKTGSKFRKTVNQMVCLKYDKSQSKFCLR
ncbi:hypothetical protein EGW08_008053, partial [Elysia chlorotica]